MKTLEVKLGSLRAGEGGSATVEVSTVCAPTQEYREEVLGLFLIFWQ